MQEYVCYWYTKKSNVAFPHFTCCTELSIQVKQAKLTFFQSNKKITRAKQRNREMNERSKRKNGRGREKNS